MLSLLLVVFAVISAVHPQNCNQFATYVHDSDILQHLHGTYYELASSSTTIFDCEIITWSGNGSSLQGIVQSPNCCRKLYDPIISEDEIEFKVAPLNMNSGCLLSTDNVKMKFISTTGVGGELCYVNTVCRADREGFFLFCREPTMETSLLQAILNLLFYLIGVLFGRPVFNDVSQANCTYPANNCNG